MPDPYELAPLPPEPEPVIPLPPEPTAVEDDLACRGCGYNLRGLSVASRCPECGAPVGVSINGDLLQFSEPRFVGKLRQGIRLMLWGMLVSVISVFAMIVATVIDRRATTSVPMRLLPLCGAALNIWGAWLLTMPDPSGVGEDRYGTVRKIIRIALAVGIVRHVAAFGSHIPIPPAASLIVQVIIEVGALIGVVGIFAQLQYLQKLAMRLPSQDLADRAMHVKWGYTTPWAVITLFALLALLIGRRAMVASGLFVVSGCIGGLSAIVMLIYAIVYVVLLLNFGRALAEHADLAQANWGTTSGA